MKNKHQSNSADNLPNDRRFTGNFPVYFIILAIILTVSACSTVRLQLNEITPVKKANLPRNMQSAAEDANIVKESSCVITVEDNSGNYLFGKEKVSKDAVMGKITEKMKDKSPDQRIVYIESDIEVDYNTIVVLIDLIRRVEIDKVGFVVIKKEDDKVAKRPTMLEVKIPAEPKPDDMENLKPNPLFLVAAIDKTRRLLLNTDSMGDVSDTTALTKKLTEVFKDREKNGVLREGTNEVEKTVFVKAAKSLKYGDVIKLIDAVKLAGAYPISLQIDDLSE